MNSTKYVHLTFFHSGDIEAICPTSVSGGMRCKCSDGFTLYGAIDCKPLSQNIKRSSELQLWSAFRDEDWIINTGILAMSDEGLERYEY
jgi:hypothetical protein